MAASSPIFSTNKIDSWIKVFMREFILSSLWKEQYDKVKIKRKGLLKEYIGFDSDDSDSQ